MVVANMGADEMDAAMASGMNAVTICPQLVGVDNILNCWHMQLGADNKMETTMS